jgi:predicted pyridoxine 5'-phosphate oxidase superfamily flavin-nucleotide-binding protein
MERSTTLSSDVAFTPAVKEIQQRKGSRRVYRHMEEGGSWQTMIKPDLAAFIAEQTSVFLGTANKKGQPYIQHRGGPKGFLRVIDEKTIAFVDYAGNRQYITQGNLTENPKAFLFLIDYAHQRRIKIWGDARVVEGDQDLIQSLMPDGYRARPEQVILFTVSAWDVNCKQHIPQRFEASDVAAALAERDKRIAELEAEIRSLRRAPLPATQSMLLRHSSQYSEDGQCKRAAGPGAIIGAASDDVAALPPGSGIDSAGKELE